MKAELKAFLKNRAKQLESDFNDVPEWVIEAAADFFESKKAGKIEDRLGDYISEDSEHYPKIIEALRKALKKDPDAMVDSVQFDKGEGDEVSMETITMWEPLEYTLTVQQLCATIGIK